MYLDNPDPNNLKTFVFELNFTRMEFPITNIPIMSSVHTRIHFC